MNGYKAYAQVLDWGGHVTKMVVRMPETVSALDPADFTVHVQKIDPETGMVAMTPKSFFSKTMRSANWPSGRPIPATGTGTRRPPANTPPSSPTTDPSTPIPA